MLKFTLGEKYIHIARSQCHVCWWHVDAKSLNISSHEINLIRQEYSGPITREVFVVQVGVGVTKSPFVNYSVTENFDWAEVYVRQFQSRSPQLSCGDTWQIRTWHQVLNQCFDHVMTSSVGAVCQPTLNLSSDTAFPFLYLKIKILLVFLNKKILSILNEQTVYEPFRNLYWIHCWHPCSCFMANLVPVHVCNSFLLSMKLRWLEINNRAHT